MSAPTNVITGQKQPEIKLSFPGLDGFEITRPPDSQRMVVSIWGLDKTGKTSLGLTFPAPRVYMSLDIGLRALLIDRPELVGSVMHKNYELTEEIDPGHWQKILDQFVPDYIKALAYAEHHAGTVIIDTASELWKIVSGLKVDQVRRDRMAKAEARTYENDFKRDQAMERADKASRLDWGEANAFMAGLLRRSTHTERASVVFINRAREEYNGSGVPTGLFKFQGFGETPAIVDAVIQMTKKGGDYYGLVERCRHRGSIEGLEVKDPSFPTLYALIAG